MSRLDGVLVRPEPLEALGDEPRQPVGRAVVVGGVGERAAHADVVGEVRLHVRLCLLDQTVLLRLRQRGDGLQRLLGQCLPVVVVEAPLAACRLPGSVHQDAEAAALVLVVVGHEVPLPALEEGRVLGARRQEKRRVEDVEVDPGRLGGCVEALFQDEVDRLAQADGLSAVVRQPGEQVGRRDAVGPGHDLDLVPGVAEARGVALHRGAVEHEPQLVVSRGVLRVVEEQVVLVEHHAGGPIEGRVVGEELVGVDEGDGHGSGGRAGATRRLRAGSHGRFRSGSAPSAYEIAPAVRLRPTFFLSPCACSSSSPPSSAAATPPR